MKNSSYEGNLIVMARAEKVIVRITFECKGQVSEAIVIHVHMCT